jgi:hypothetical protein
MRKVVETKSERLRSTPEGYAEDKFSIPIKKTRDSTAKDTAVGCRTFLEALGRSLAHFINANTHVNYQFSI